MRKYMSLAVMFMGLLSVSGNLMAEPRPFEDVDLFDIEYVTDPQISPDGKMVVYVRRGFDIMNDSARNNLWLATVDGKRHEPLSDSKRNASSPRWSPDGKKIAYVGSEPENGKRQLYVLWLASGNTIDVTHLTESPGNLVWSPDGKQIAFTQRVPQKPKSIGELPKKPKGATWAEDAVVIDDLLYRSDGAGFRSPGVKQVFLVPSEGGAPRQITKQAFGHNSRVSWGLDSKTIYYSANYNEDWQRQKHNSEIYRLNIDSGIVTSLTNREGPDYSPKVSPDGKSIIYLGSDYVVAYQLTELYISPLSTFKPRLLTADFPRSISSAVWSSDSKHIFVSYVEDSVTKIASIDLNGKMKVLAEGLGGNSIGRPYSSGSFSLSRQDTLAYTQGNTSHPADLIVQTKNKKRRALTSFGKSFAEVVEMGQVEEIIYQSSHDGKDIQGWIVKPPGFDAAKSYPLILEIHGGPMSSYAAEFSAELQLFAAAGYVVLYTNPRGSTSYGLDFTREIYQAYPGEDFDDLMSGVDEVISRGYIDEENLFVTGGSGGGVLTAWIVGKTNRFRAAVSAKPVINWFSHTLTADIGSFFWKINFDQLPWENPMAYFKLSPISLVGNVTTPTMLLTGEVDTRTPMSESEQYYQALKMRGVDSMLVRIPAASHSITKKPSNLLRKTAYILGWFEKYRNEKVEE